MDKENKNIFDKLHDWSNKQELKDFEKIIKETQERTEDPKAFEKKRKKEEIVRGIIEIIITAVIIIPSSVVLTMYILVFIIKSGYDIKKVEIAIVSLKILRVCFVAGLISLIYYSIRNLNHFFQIFAPLFLLEMLCISLVFIISMLAIPKFEVVLDSLKELELLSQI